MNGGPVGTDYGASGPAPLAAAERVVHLAFGTGGGGERGKGSGRKREPRKIYSDPLNRRLRKIPL